MKRATKIGLWVILPVLVVVRFLVVSPEGEDVQAPAPQQVAARQQIATTQSTAAAKSFVARLVTQMQDPKPGARITAERQLDRPSQAVLPWIEQWSTNADLPASVRETLQEIVRLEPERKRRDAYRDRGAREKVWFTKIGRIAYFKLHDKQDHSLMNLLDHWAESPACDNTVNRQDDSLRELVKQVRTSGTEDPLALYQAATAMECMGEDEESVGQAMRKAAAKMEGSGYSAVWKCWAMFDGAKYSANAPEGSAESNRAEAQRLIEEGMKLLPEVLKDPSIPRKALLLTMRKISGCSKGVLGDRMALSQRAWPILEQSCANAGTVMTAKGLTYLAWAQDAAAGAPQRNEGMAKAADLLEQAWNADANNDAAAYGMEVLSAAQGSDPQVQRWFDRTMAANPDSYAACMTRLEYLEERGDMAAMLSFARDCRRGRNWKAGLPGLVVDAHIKMAQRDADGRSELYPICGYFERHPEAWEDIKGALHFSLGSSDSMRYTMFAALGGDWDEAQRGFNRAGDSRGLGVSNIPDDLVLLLEDEAARRISQNYQQP